jgi:hypothetical protein
MIRECMPTRMYVSRPHLCAGPCSQGWGKAVKHDVSWFCAGCDIVRPSATAKCRFSGGRTATRARRWHGPHAKWIPAAIDSHTQPSVAGHGGGNRSTVRVQQRPPARRPATSAPRGEQAGGTVRNTPEETQLVKGAAEWLVSACIPPTYHRVGLHQALWHEPADTVPLPEMRVAACVKPWALHQVAQLRRLRL